VTTPLWILAIALVALGILGTVIPALPGAPLAFAGLVLAAWIDHFQKVGAITLIFLGLLTLAALAVDVLAGVLGAQKARASRTAVVGASIGTLVGLFFGIPGLLLGPFVGAVIGELAVRKDWAQAGRAGVATWIGLLVGTLLKLAIIFAMVAVFVMAYLVG
jgi:uncharacterized protein